MTFTELLASLPTTQHTDWEAAATRELRGKALSSIDLQLADNELRAAPYASPEGQSAQATAEFSSYGFAQISDLSTLPELTVADILAELEGGASGFAFDLSRQRTDWSGAGQIRFDYITTCARGSQAELAAFAKALVELLPPEQISAMRVQVEPVDADTLDAVEAMRHHFLRTQLVLAVPAAGTLESRLGRALQGWDRCARLTTDTQAFARELVISYTPTANYLETLVTQRAIQFLFVNWCAQLGLAEPLPNPVLWQRIPVEADQGEEAHLVDATCRAVAGLSAGASQVSVRPHAAGDSATQRRRARNVLNLLAIESHLGKQGDALRGASLVEGLAEQLARAVWDEF